MKIIADDKIPFLQGMFEPFYDIDYLPGNKIDRGVLNGVEILIIRTRTICNKELLEGSSVKFIATATIGFDHIDTDYCKKNNIEWVCAPGCNSRAVQQWFMAALLYYAKLKSIDLSQKTLGVIGVGNVGRKVVEFAESIGMTVLLNDPPRQEKESACFFRELETLQRECDILSFHVPLIREGKNKTYHMFNEDFLSKLNPNTILINSSRGEVFDNYALNKFVKSEKYGGLFLDVWEGEPIISEEILESTNIATPHIAGYSLEGKANGTAAVVQAVGEFLELPFGNWYPDEIPANTAGNIKINCRNKSIQEIITEVILATYPIINDDKSLRIQPQKFEFLRSTYHFRHEPLAFKVELLNGTTEVRKKVQDLGFSIV